LLITVYSVLHVMYDFYTHYNPQNGYDDDHVSVHTHGYVLDFSNAHVDRLSNTVEPSYCELQGTRTNKLTIREIHYKQVC
jgi:hypothetical protein